MDPTWQKAAIWQVWWETPVLLAKSGNPTNCGSAYKFPKTEARLVDAGPFLGLSQWAARILTNSFSTYTARLAE